MRRFIAHIVVFASAPALASALTPALAPALASPAAKLFPAKTTEYQRQLVLKNYFDPQPGEAVHIDKTSLDPDKAKKHPERMRGYIKVSPPKGICLRITRRDSRPDIDVCEPKVLGFLVEDLDFTGHLYWRVRVKGRDELTVMRWKSSVRFGKVVTLDMKWPGAAKPMIIHECVAHHTRDRGREFFLHLLTGDRWRVRLPDTEVMVKQPRMPPNLYRFSARKEEKLGVEPDPEAKRLAELSLILPQLVNPEDIDKFDRKEWVPTWQTHPRYSYTMSADNVSPGQSVTPGLKGKCRYRYYGHRQDPGTGTLECHNTLDHHWIYLPVTCLGQLRIK